MNVLKDILLVWKTLVLIFVPLLASPILMINGSKELACLYGVILISTFWITEALPLSVTALTPIVIFPLLGVLPAKDVALSYVKDVSMFSFSCLSFALCIEKWQLHKRIALTTLLYMGASPKWLTLGFMLPTWFLSLWVNNTSATAMMVPVVIAILDQLYELEASKTDSDNLESSEAVEKIPNKKPDSKQHAIKNHIDDEEFHYPSEDYKHMCKVLNLCVCYAASLGGIGSITGSSTNLIMQGQADAIFESYGLQSGVNFLNWFLCCFPVAFLCLIFAWLWLIVHFLGFRELTNWSCGDTLKSEALRSVVKDHLKKLGPLSFAEKSLIGHFIVLLAFWLSMKFPGGVGWSYFFKPEYVNNSTPGIIMLLSLFIFPCEKPQIFGSKKNKSDDNFLPRPVPALLDWKSLHDLYPWGTWCLLGGGYAIAHICQESGLSLWIATQLSVFSNMQPWIMLVILTLIISFMTEITSNAAMISILCPILAELALSMQMNPLYLLLPATLACSLAFMLPVATPPNAIVFAIGHIKVKEMVKAGFVLNCLCILVINVATNTWMNALLDLTVIPPSMNRKLNQTHVLLSANNSTL